MNQYYAAGYKAGLKRAKLLAVRYADIDQAINTLKKLGENYWNLVMNLKSGLDERAVLDILKRISKIAHNLLSNPKVNIDANIGSRYYGGFTVGEALSYVVDLSDKTTYYLQRVADNDQDSSDIAYMLIQDYEANNLKGIINAIADSLWITNNREWDWENIPS